MFLSDGSMFGLSFSLIQKYFGLHAIASILSPFRSCHSDCLTCVVLRVSHMIKEYNSIFAAALNYSKNQHCIFIKLSKQQYASINPLKKL